PGRGLGLACNLHNSGGRRSSPFDGSAALVKVEADGSVILVTGEGDTGQGAWSTLSQMVAEDLGIPYSSVQVTRPDTESAPYCLGSFASRLTVLGGGAVRAAAEDARNQLIGVTAGLLEANPRDLVCRQGNIFVKGVPEKSISFAQAARAAVNRIGGGPVIGRGVYDPPTEMQDPDTLYGNYALNYPFCAQVAEVEVDEETGQVKLISLISADDLGKAINPLSADGQVEGCAAHGIGFALIEELVWQHGNLISGTLMDYRQPTAGDINQLKSILVEPDDPVGPFGAKGVAESSVAPVAAAIANAIYDAVGVRIRSAPITAEKVLQALKEKKSRS
ncbi:MAG: molybdopterin cofactor-binding domain-containing protein, partial [Dehalococcoidales bacterium]